MPPAGKVAPIPLNSARSAASIRLRPPQCVVPKHLGDCRALIHALDLTCGAIQEILLVRRHRHACDNSPLRTRRPACAEPDHHAREDDFASHEASGAAHRTPPIPVRVVPGDDHCARRSAASDARKAPATAAYIPRRRIHGRARLQLIAVPLRPAADRPSPAARARTRPGDARQPMAHSLPCRHQEPLQRASERVSPDPGDECQTHGRESGSADVLDAADDDPRGEGLRDPAPIVQAAHAV